MFGQSGYIRARWFYSGKSSCILANRLYSSKVVVFGQSGCFLVRGLYSGNVVAFKQSGSI